MLKKKKFKYKIILHNYQVYESGALTEMIEKQSIKGYHLFKTIGGFCKILIFRHDEIESPKAYAVYRKNYDEQNDLEIEHMKSEKKKIISETNYYIILESSMERNAEIKLEEVEKRQNNLLGISVKRLYVFSVFLFALSIVSLILKQLLIGRGNLQPNLFILSLCVALDINFFIYLIGDIHDIAVGKGNCNNDILYFSTRTRFKNILFHIADILKFGILIGSICLSAAILIKSHNAVAMVKILQLWLAFIIGFGYGLRSKYSYMSLMVTAIFLTLFS